MLGRALLPSEVTDHINRDRLDNRRENLRLATVACNTANRAQARRKRVPYKGVFPTEKAGLWKAGISINHAFVYLGRFSSPEEAAFVYDQVALQLYGGFAYTNFEYE
jgi:hypothetical protein